MGIRKVLSRTLDIIVVPAVLLSLGLAFLYAPPEKTMHDVYRIFYFHVPATASAGLGIAIVFVCSVLYLRTRDRRYDLVAAVSEDLAGRVPTKRRVSVLPCGVASDRFRPIPRAEAREKLGLNSTGPYLL